MCLKPERPDLAATLPRLSSGPVGQQKKQKPAGDKATVEVWVLNLISGGTIRAVELDQVTKLELEDKQLQEELGKALLALAQSRDQDSARC